MAKFKVGKDKAGEWRFALFANNGKIVAVGEGYKKKRSAENGIECIKKLAKSAEIVYLD